MKATTVVAVSVLVTACSAARDRSSPPPDPPTADPASGATDAEPPRTMDEIAAARNLREAEERVVLDALRQRARGAELQDESVAPVILAEVNPTQPVVTPGEMDHRALETEPERGAEGPEAIVNPRLFATEPQASLSRQGTLTLRFRATRAVPGAALYFGGEVPSDPFTRARLRRRATELEERDGEYQIGGSIRPLLRGKYDVAANRTRGRGTLHYRLSAMDVERGESRTYDGRLSFRCEPLPCTETEDTSFIETATVRLGPFVDRIDATHATISFETDRPTVGVVAYRPAQGEQLLIRGSERPSTRHELRLEDLQSDTRYSYVVGAIDGRNEPALGRIATFRTWPAPTAHQRTRFAVFSDSRSGHGVGNAHYAGTNREILDSLLTGALREGAQFVVFVGDLIDGYRTHVGSFVYELRAWQRATEAVGALIPIYEVMGNHEALMHYWTPGWAVDRSGPESAETQFAERFVNPENGPEAESDAPPYEENVYSFDAGPAHLAVINSNYFWRSHVGREDHPAAARGEREGWVNDRQIQWLRRDLETARQGGRAHLFVFTHEPGFPNGGHVHDAMWWNGEIAQVLEQRALLFRTMADQRVAAIFHGDEHNYSRTRIHAGLIDEMSHPLWQITSGGAGAPYYAQDTTVPWAQDVARFDPRQHFVLVDASREAVRARAISISGEVIDEVDLADANVTDD